MGLRWGGEGCDGVGEGAFVREERGHDGVEAVFGEGGVGVQKDAGAADLERESVGWGQGGGGSGSGGCGGFGGVAD